MRIIGSSNEHLILDGVSIQFNPVNDRCERVDNVITVTTLVSMQPKLGFRYSHQSIADPVAAESHVILEHRNPAANMGCVRVRSKAEAQSSLAENHHVDIEWFIIGLTVLQHNIE